MKKYIKLIYWNNSIYNYGDLLSPYIIKHLSNKKIIHKNYFVGNQRSHIYHLIKSLLRLDFNLTEVYQFPFEKNLIGIGSILSTGNSNSDIWGAGFMSENEECKGGTIYAIRGKLSLNKIRKQIAQGDKIKLINDVAIGDPALLLPELIKSAESKKYKLGIIPHFSETEYFINNYGSKYHVIDLRSNEIERVTNDITSCEKILSTSLHGIIVAHAYGIPAIWMEYTGLEPNTFGFKFRDYFSSVGIPEYIPIRNIKEVLESEYTLEDKFKSLYTESLPQYDLNKIKENLIRTAPFQIVRK